MNRGARAARHRSPALLGVFVLILAVVGCSHRGSEDAQRETPAGPRLEMTSLLSGDAEGFARAVEARTFEFPRDHGPHPDFRTEWWYLTGNLEAASGRRFGYQFTIFRSAIAADAPPRSSQWATRQIYMAHLALTDVDAGRFFSFERFARGAAGLAGAELLPLRVWVEDWQLSGDDAPPPLELTAANAEIGLDLELDAVKPLVLQGEAGLSRKGRQPGNASYYYAFTRLATAGSIRVGGDEFEVEGTSWLDREWSTSALEEGQRGWDWFALQLDDGSEVMVYQMRRDDGSPDPVSSGSRIDAAGSKRSLGWEEFELEVLDWWTSPATGVRYPSGWRLSVPGEDLLLRVEPVLREQELELSVLYWEGAVRVEGSRAGKPISGKGYVKLTGYGPP